MPRTKQPDRERYPNGRAKPIEGPTAETAKKFQDKAAALHIPAHKEAGFAESTIGVLEARGIISIEQAELCKKLANLRSVLYGSGNAKCSSIENVGRGLPNDGESKAMRETWTAYKAATADMEPADRRIFEIVILIPTVRQPGSEIWLTWNPDLEEDDTYQRFVVHPDPTDWKTLSAARIRTTDEQYRLANQRWHDPRLVAIRQGCAPVLDFRSEHLKREERRQITRNYDANNPYGGDAA